MLALRAHLFLRLGHKDIYVCVVSIAICNEEDECQLHGHLYHQSKFITMS